MTKSALSFQPKAQKKVIPNLSHSPVKATKTFQPAQINAGQGKLGANSKFWLKKSGSVSHGSPDQMLVKNAHVGHHGGGMDKKLDVPHKNLLSVHGTEPKKLSIPTGDTVGATPFNKNSSYSNRPSKTPSGGAGKGCC